MRPGTTPRRPPNRLSAGPSLASVHLLPLSPWSGVRAWGPTGNSAPSSQVAIRERKTRQGNDPRAVAHRIGMVAPPRRTAQRHPWDDSAARKDHKTGRPINRPENADRCRCCGSLVLFGRWRTPILCHLNGAPERQIVRLVELELHPTVAARIAGGNSNGAPR